MTGPPANDWIHENIFQDLALFEQFQIFWGFSWFGIVKGWHALEFALLLLLCVPPTFLLNIRKRYFETQTMWYWQCQIVCDN